MKSPTVRGLIRRRILVNFRVDPAAMQRQLPPPFRPKLLAGAGVGGVCLIRLEQVRPDWLALPVGLSSENAAHRVAVCWTDDASEEQEGVYVPRRDTDSRLSTLAGGRLFPGEYQHARFDARDDGDRIDFAMRSDDGEVEIRLRARAAAALPETSRFADLEEASTFFERGALGYSARRGSDALDAIRLRTDRWHVEPLAVEEVHSSYFAAPERFPPGSVEFDCALLMRDIPHEWEGEPPLEPDR